MRYAKRFIDLHLHLDGAITPDIARRLARLQDIPLPDSREELERLLSVSPDCAGLDEFLQCFAFPLSLLQTPEGLRQGVRLVADHARRQGVIYAEIRFAPQLHTNRGMTQEDAVLAALDGMKRTRQKINLIFCCMRGEGNERQNEETVALAKKYLVPDGGVVAIDLAGAEGRYPTADYAELLAKAHEDGIPLTVHAGEADGPQSVRDAVACGARRIGHGARIAGDPATVALVKERGVTLEMCPTSNRLTRAVEDMTAYPLADFLRRGVRVTVNTDDPAIERTALAEEFRYMERTFGLTAAQEQILLRNAVDAAFTTDEVKTRLKRRLGLS